MTREGRVGEVDYLIWVEGKVWEILVSYLVQKEREEKLIIS